MSTSADPVQNLVRSFVAEVQNVMACVRARNRTDLTPRLMAFLSALKAVQTAVNAIRQDVSFDDATSASARVVMHAKAAMKASVEATIASEFEAMAAAVVESTAGLRLAVNRYSELRLAAAREAAEARSRNQKQELRVRASLTLRPLLLQYSGSVHETRQFLAMPSAVTQPERLVEHIGGILKALKALSVDLMLLGKSSTVANRIAGELVVAAKARPLDASEIRGLLDRLDMVLETIVGEPIPDPPKKVQQQFRVVKPGTRRRDTVDSEDGGGGGGGGGDGAGDGASGSDGRSAETRDDVASWLKSQRSENARKRDQLKALQEEKREKRDKERQVREAAERARRQAETTAANELAQAEAERIEAIKASAAERKAKKAAERAERERLEREEAARLQREAEEKAAAEAVAKAEAERLERERLHKEAVAEERDRLLQQMSRVDDRQAFMDRKRAEREAREGGNVSAGVAQVAQKGPMAGAIRLPIAAEETRRSRSVTEVMHDLDDDDVGGGNGGGNGGSAAAPSFNFEPRVSTLSVGTDLDRMSTSDAMDAMLDDLANLGTSAAQQRKRDSTGDAIESLLGDLGGAEAVANNKTPAASVRLGGGRDRSSSNDSMDAALAELMAAADKDEADAAAASTNAASTAVPSIVEESGPARPPRGRTRESMAGGGPQAQVVRRARADSQRNSGVFALDDLLNDLEGPTSSQPSGPLLTVAGVSSAGGGGSRKRADSAGSDFDLGESLAGLDDILGTLENDDDDDDDDEAATAATAGGGMTAAELKAERRKTMAEIEVDDQFDALDGLLADLGGRKNTLDFDGEYEAVVDASGSSKPDFLDFQTVKVMALGASDPLEDLALEMDDVLESAFANDPNLKPEDYDSNVAALDALVADLEGGF